MLELEGIVKITPARQLRACHLTSQGLSFLICKMIKLTSIPQILDSHSHLDESYF